MSDSATPNATNRLGKQPHTLNATATAATQATDSTVGLGSGTVLETHGATLKVIRIDSLWHAPSENPSQVIRALDLLKQASDILGKARAAESIIDADQFIQAFQMLLPKLFTYRAVGDGFGLIVNSLHYAFVNLHGKPLTKEQVTTIWRTIRELRVKPAMSPEQGLERVGEFEELGLEIDPPGIGDLCEGLESTRYD
jgi:hypothetical protein